jgi:predicted RNA-binding protein with PIN domain
MIASSGLDIKKSSPPQISVSSNKKQLNIKTTAHALLQGLDSGYSKANSYFKYDETNQEVKLVAEKAINEEKNKLKQQIEVATRGKIQQQISKTKTTGSKWFDMSSHELTEDVKRDFALLRMRNYLDPKKFYKVNFFYNDLYFDLDSF